MNIKLTSLFLLLGVSFNAVALPITSALLNWSAPTQYTDGTPLLLRDISSYKVYYGQQAKGPYPYFTTVSSLASSIQVNNLTTGPWYFVITTKVTSGVESSYSVERSKTITKTKKIR